MGPYEWYIEHRDTPGIIVNHEYRIWQQGYCAISIGPRADNWFIVYMGTGGDIDVELPANWEVLF